MRRDRGRRVRDEKVVTEILRQVAATPRMGCRKVLTMICRRRGWRINHKRGERLWKQLRLNARRVRAVRKPSPGSSANACDVLRAERPRHVYCCDFIYDATEDGRQLKWLSVFDECTRECLALEVEWSMDHRYALEVILRVVDQYGVPEFIRSDNGGEFIAEGLRAGLAKLGVDVKFIEPGAPWQNGYSESFHSQVRAELLDMEVFTGLAHAKQLGRAYRRMYNHERPHGSLGMLTPAEWAAQQGRPEPNRQPVESRARPKASTGKALRARPVTQRAPRRFTRA